MERKRCTPAQFALSWLKAQSDRPGMPIFVPVPGARSEARGRENATNVQVLDADIMAIQVNFEQIPCSKVVGGRHLVAAAKLTEY